MDIDSITENTAEVVKELSKEVYTDGLSPAVKNFGIGLGNITSAFKLVTLPFALAGYTADALEKKFKNFLETTFNKVPEENLVSPDPMVSVPIAQNIIQAFDKEVICEMYSNLLASASNSEYYAEVHPAFPFIISQLNAVDVAVLEDLKSQKFHCLPFLVIKVRDVIFRDPFCLVKNYENDYSSVTSSLHNLSRLGLITKTENSYFTDYDYDVIYQSEFYSEIRNAPDIQEYIQKIKGIFSLTNFGVRFMTVCSQSPI